MKKLIKFLVLILVFVLVIVLMFFLKNYKIEKIIPIENNQNIIEEVANKNLSLEDQEKISDFIKENISALSPEKEVLGGKFYITNIEFISNNLCKVEYEDGHIALSGNLEFVFSEDKEIKVIEFKILED